MSEPRRNDPDLHDHLAAIDRPIDKDFGIAHWCAGSPSGGWPRRSGRR